MAREAAAAFSPSNAPGNLSQFCETFAQAANRRTRVGPRCRIADSEGLTRAAKPTRLADQCTARKLRMISGQPEVAINSFLKLNRNCGDDRGPDVAPQTEQHA